MHEADEDQRIARTEALFRGVNERIADSAGRYGAAEASFVCECHDAGCTHRIYASLDDYDDVRADGAQFLVAREHVDPAVERVVERRPRFWLVEKVKPRIRTTVKKLDPRAQNA
jgi:hypothetical protein